MQINATWNVSDRIGTEIYSCRNVKLARIWPVGARWQMAIDLPLFWKPDNHIFDTKEAAIECVTKNVQYWFDYVDA